MSRKKEGFAALLHNEVRDITVTLLSDVCKNVELEPSLLTLNEERETIRKTAETNEGV